MAGRGGFEPPTSENGDAARRTDVTDHPADRTVLLVIRDQPHDGRPQDLPLGIIFGSLETVGRAFHRLLFALRANTTARRHHVLAAALAYDRHRPVAQQDLKRKTHVSTATLEPTRRPGLADPSPEHPLYHILHLLEELLSADDQARLAWLSCDNTQKPR